MKKNPPSNGRHTDADKAKEQNSDVVVNQTMAAHSSPNCEIQAICQHDSDKTNDSNKSVLTPDQVLKQLYTLIPQSALLSEHERERLVLQVEQLDPLRRLRLLQLLQSAERLGSYKHR